MSDSKSSCESRKRLEQYPDRFRARIAGRVVQVKFSASETAPKYEAVLEVEKSRPLPPVNAQSLTGIPMVEVIGDDLDDAQEVAADDDEADVDSVEDAASEDEAQQNITLYRVYKREAKPAPLYPDYPPVRVGDHIVLVWHGQKSVPGILAGTYLRCSGMYSSQKKRIFNPRYEIVPQRAGLRKK